MKRIFLLIILGLAGCQSKADALKIVCETPAQPNVRNASPEMHSRMMSKHVESNISNGEIKDLYWEYSGMSDDSRHKALRKVLDAEGISNCKMLEVWKLEEKK